MFTGIVQTRGRLESLQRNDFGARLTVSRNGLSGPINHGDSICVSGVCLTAVAIDERSLGFDVIAETLAVTKLGELREGDAVNLEPALTLSQPLGGHFVQGHIDGVGEVVRVVDDPEQWRTTVRPPADFGKYLSPKGSVTVDGVSLTLAALNGDGTFDLALIPETLERTTLGQTREGERVNLEADILTKTVVRWLEQRAAAAGGFGGVTAELLQEAGFMTGGGNGTGSATETGG